MGHPPRLFAPGPVEVPERIRLALGEPIYHHRTADFRAILVDVRDRLARLWQAPGWEPLVLNCSGSGAMEGAVVNLMSRGEKAINVCAGKFGERWGHILRAYGCEVAELTLEWGRSVTPGEVLDLLAKHPDVKAIYLTSADTSTGGEHPIEELGPAIRRVSDALIVVDCICDFGGARDIRPIDWQIDAAVSCSQKCLLLPPGLGFAALGPRAIQRMESADINRFYFDWRLELVRQRDERLTAWTSAVNLIRGLQESLAMIEEEGLERVVERYARQGAAVRAAVEATGLELFPELPTSALTAVSCGPDLDGTRVVELARSKYGYQLVNGQDRLRGKIFRIGHMGVQHDGDIVGVVQVLECVLADLGALRCQPGEAVAAAAASLHGVAEDRSPVSRAS
jgi:serine---pyruvate transaminase